MPNTALYYQSGSPIGEIIINQPTKRNAISAHMWSALADAVIAAEADKAANVIVIRGAGGHFAAGADISEFEEVYKTTQSANAYTQTMLECLSLLEHCTKPTIAQIDGACVGGGCSIALACDFRFAATAAKFGVTPGKLGLIYSLADTRRLTAAVGKSGARDLLLTARLIDGAEAHKMGLCDRLFSIDDLNSGVKAFSNQIASLSQWSVRTTKQMLRLLDNSAADDDKAAMQLMLDAFSGADFKEGYQAFLAKRKPDFPGG